MEHFLLLVALLLLLLIHPDVIGGTFPVRPGGRGSLAEGPNTRRNFYRRVAGKSRTGECRNFVLLFIYF